MNARVNNAGFAMVLVLIALMVAVTLGMSYLATASLKTVGSRNLVEMDKAKYLAESGVQHAMYVIRADLSALNNSAHLGPYYLDSSPDSYTFWATPDSGTPSLYHVTADGVAGGVHRQVFADVQTSTTRLSASQAMQIGSGSVSLPSALTLNGNVAVNGNLTNYARVNGNVVAHGTITDSNGGIKGLKTPNSASVSVPAVLWSNYLAYSTTAASGSATVVTSANNSLAGGDPLTNGSAITRQNPAGVVQIKPKTGTTITLKPNAQFTGTLIVNGNLVIDGAGITLKATDGFPALVVTGTVTIKNNASITINGLVSADGGIVSSGNTPNSTVVINGGVIAKTVGFDYGVKGTDTVNFDSQKADIYDLSGNTPCTLNATMVSFTE